MRGLHIPQPTPEGTGLEECDLISHSPDELLAEVAIGPLSPQETGVWNLHLRILISDKAIYLYFLCLFSQQKSFTFDAQVDPTGALRWRTLAPVSSCGTTSTNLNETFVTWITLLSMITWIAWMTWMAWITWTT